MNLYDRLNIDSRDRISGSDNSFVVNTPSSNRIITKYVLREVDIPLVFDNVLSGWNTIKCTVTSVDTLYTIPNGQYNLSSLILELNTQMTGYVWSLTNQKRVKVVRAGGVFTMDLLGSTTSGTDGLHTTLGWAVGTTQSGAATYTGLEVPNLIPTRYFTLHSKYISSISSMREYLTDNRSDCIAYISAAGANLGEILKYEPAGGIVYTVEGRNGSTLDFEIRDEYNAVVDLQSEDFTIRFERYTD